jgi:cell division protein FtsZ
VPSSPATSNATASHSSYSASDAADAQAARQAQAAGQPGQPGAADPIAEVPAQPASDGPPGYVPSEVSFVSDEEDEYRSKPGYGGYDRDDDGGDAAPGWKDAGRTGKQDNKVFDVPAGRRRPVVFEEEDDLDVPDFLK